MVRSVWESMQPWWWSYDVRWCHGWEQFLGEMDGSTGDNRYIITGAGGSRPDAQVSLIMYPRPHRPVGHIIQNPARVRLRRDSFCRVEGSLDYLFRSWICESDQSPPSESSASCHEWLTYVSRFDAEFPPFQLGNHPSVLLVEPVSLDRWLRFHSLHQSVPTAG